MTKNEFITIMAETKILRDNMEGVNQAMRKLDPDFNGFYNPRAEELILTTIKIAMKDNIENSWIDYFVYETDWGTKWRKGCVTIDGKDIPLGTIEELWGCLTK